MEDKKEEEKHREPLKFPKKFDHCPNPECGSTRRLCLEATRDRIKGPQDTIPILTVGTYQYIGVAGQVTLLAFLDVCVDCGTLYAVEITKRLDTNIILPPGPLTKEN